jgi:hypothetical protein
MWTFRVKILLVRLCKATVHDSSSETHREPAWVEAKAVESKTPLKSKAPLLNLVLLDRNTELFKITIA